MTDHSTDPGELGPVLMLGILLIVYFLYKGLNELAVITFMVMVSAALLSKTLSSWKQAKIYGASTGDEDK